jgi:uncharacterized protein YciI
MAGNTGAGWKLEAGNLEAGSRGAPMNYYALLYDGATDYVTRRVPHRDAHLALVREAHARGEILYGGAIGNPPSGALIVFRSPTPAVAEQFARRDPYVLNGVVTGWRVLPWHIVVGGPES